MLWAVGIIGAATLLWNLGASLLVATERFLALNFWQVSQGLLALAAIIVCAAVDATPEAFVLATALAATATALCQAWFIATRSSGAMRFSFTLIRSGVGYSSRAYFVLLLGYLLQRSGASLLVAAGNLGELGQFSVASQLFDALLIVPGSVSLVLFPLAVRHGQKVWHHVARTAAFTTGGMAALCALTALAAPVVVPWVFGARFAESVVVLWSLLPTVIAYTLVSILSQYLIARHFPWSLVVAWGAGLAVALITGFRLTRIYGAVGAALSQSCGAALVCVLVVAIAYRRSDRLRRSQS
jgi:O-antigen/teichoic acid export membrane protein